VISLNDNRCCDPEKQWARVTSTIVRCCYQMETVATGKDMMLPKPVATEGHNSDGRFGDITEEPL
jgi:hypothetical protein